MGIPGLLSVINVFLFLEALVVEEERDFFVVEDDDDDDDLPTEVVDIGGLEYMV